MWRARGCLLRWWPKVRRAQHVAESHGRRARRVPGPTHRVGRFVRIGSPRRHSNHHRRASDRGGRTVDRRSPSRHRHEAGSRHTSGCSCGRAQASSQHCLPVLNVGLRAACGLRARRDWSGSATGFGSTPARSSAEPDEQHLRREPSPRTDEIIELTPGRARRAGRRRCLRGPTPICRSASVRSMLVIPNDRERQGDEAVAGQQALPDDVASASVSDSHGQTRKRSKSR